MPLTLENLNDATAAEAQLLLDGLYEHSPWVVERAWAHRPFPSIAALQYALCKAVDDAALPEQLALLRAHPELAGKAMVDQSLTADSNAEQNLTGLTRCTPEEFATLHRLNAAYTARFGHPFILAVRGPRGTGLTKQHIIATFARRVQGHAEFERQECLRNVHRIAQLRLNERLDLEPTLGNQVWDWHERLAEHSDPGHCEHGQLTVTYLTDAHRACAADIAETMRACGCDHVHIDAVGNVVGRYAGDSSERPYLLTGSHYDTVRNAGKYDGRLGIFVPLACIQTLHRAGRRLPFGIEVVAFAEEEGQRYKATFLASSALTGSFNAAWLEQTDAGGVSMRDAMARAGLKPADIPAIRRNPSDYLGFVEVHIEQGPVLNALHVPLGVVTSINASVRYTGEVAGTACHAGTTPMALRQDAAAAVAELILYVEQRAAQDGDSVGTVGMLEVPGGSINVVPGRCRFSLDLRAPTDAQRDRLAHDVIAQLQAICARRGVQHSVHETMRASAAPSAPSWQRRWEQAVQSLGLPVHHMPSGAGHDAMKLHDILPQAMLFVRGENSGISHNPLESTTSDDMQLAIEAFMHLLHHLEPSHEHPL